MTALRVGCLLVAAALCGSLWGEFMWWQLGPGLATALLAGFGGVMIGIMGMSLFSRRRLKERCSSCYGDVRGACNLWGVCQLSPDAVVSVPPRKPPTQPPVPWGDVTQCRLHLMANGRPYPRSSCAVCGTLIRPDWRCARGLELRDGIVIATRPLP